MPKNERLGSGCEPIPVQIPLVPLVYPGLCTVSSTSLQARPLNLFLRNRHLWSSRSSSPAQFVVPSQGFLVWIYFRSRFGEKFTRPYSQEVLGKKGI